jgi:DNA-binding NarL/FixJ family response regulator
VVVDEEEADRGRHAALHAGDAIAAQLLAAGADAAVDKATPLSTLDVLLQEVHAGRTTTSPTTTTPSGTDAATTSLEARLSAREREVSRALARCQTPKEVAAGLGIASSTVYCHIDRIRQKLGVQTAQEIVALALSSPR